MTSLRASIPVHPAGLTTSPYPSLQASTATRLKDSMNERVLERRCVRKCYATKDNGSSEARGLGIILFATDRGGKRPLVFANYVYNF